MPHRQLAGYGKLALKVALEASQSVALVIPQHSCLCWILSQDCRQTDRQTDRQICLDIMTYLAEHTSDKMLKFIPVCVRQSKIKRKRRKYKCSNHAYNCQPATWGIFYIRFWRVNRYNDNFLKLGMSNEMERENCHIPPGFGPVTPCILDMYSGLWEQAGGIFSQPI